MANLNSSAAPIATLAVTTTAEVARNTVLSWMRVERQTMQIGPRVP